MLELKLIHVTDEFWNLLQKYIEGYRVDKYVRRM